jgi:hypothetical protein
MFHIPPWLLVILVLNIAIFVIVLNPNVSKGIPTFENNNFNQAPTSNETKPPIKSNQSSNQTSNQSLNQTVNQTNKTFNDTVYKLSCINSIRNYIKNVDNINHLIEIEARFFNKTESSISYARNWSSNSFEMIGIGKDIYSLNKTNKSTVSVNEFKLKDGRNFTLPIVCNESGSIGSYSSCMLSNISNITLYCHNLTTSLSECDIEKMEYDFWQDISYWITPKPGPLNVSQLFNFTIVSSRNRLEYAFLNISYVRPPLISKNLFNQSKTTMKGDKISITTKLNLTGKIYGGLILEASFKKKCYKYDLLAEYTYYGG